ncbi:hypothetical protein GCM10010371_63430 [Streptomyces subrutilus]|uniref:Uncharacterized protein n=1 Tax=Streptomyces subrutilus TaxID=36818 RepID=A0A918RDJ2_9ACTN|nr:hypothetical protein GCM10010371_63430 [Streptomyces subrutilus]
MGAELTLRGTPRTESPEKIPPDTDLVSDDGCIFGVGLAFTPVALRRTVDGTPGEVEHPLLVVEEDRDGQGGSTVGQVDAPGHFVAQFEDVCEESQ